MHFLGLFYVPLVIWACADAYERRVQYYWYYIIIGFPPFGPVIYLAVVKFRLQDLLSSVFSGKNLVLKPKKLTLDDAEYLARTTPSLDNKQNYANALLDNGRLDEAISVYYEVLNKDPESRAGLFGLSLATKGKGQNEESLVLLDRILEADFGYRDYQAAETKLEILCNLGRLQEARSFAEILHRKSRSVRHLTMEAQICADTGDRETAAKLAKEALYDFEHLPGYYRRSHKADLKALKKLL